MACVGEKERPNLANQTSEMRRVIPLLDPRRAAEGEDVIVSEVVRRLRLAEGRRWISGISAAMTRSMAEWETY